MMHNEHKIITPPDQVWNENISVLLLDYDWDSVGQLIMPLSGSPKLLNIYVYQELDQNPEWLLNVANASDIIVINMEKPTINDVFKGRLLNLNCHVCYTGREDLKNIWSNYSTDSLGFILSSIAKIQKTTGEQID